MRKQFCHSRRDWEAVINTNQMEIIKMQNNKANNNK